MAVTRVDAPRIAALATAIPPYILDQQEIALRVQAMFGGSEIVERLMPVFANAGIERRYSCVPVEWYDDPHGWADRNSTYLAAAVDLLERSALDALCRSGHRVEDVDALIVISSTGIATPSLDALLMERLAFKRTVQRLPIFGLGCAGGTLGLARAAEFARARPGSLVLLLVVELCGLSFRRDEVSKSNIVATALFGDGAAAAVLSTQGSGPAIVAAGEYMFPRSLGIMGWDVAKDGLRAIFSRDIPQLVRTRLRTIVDEFLLLNETSLADIDRVLAHPGGLKVIEALESVFDLEPGSLGDTRAILREFGNMSAATVLFVLDRSLQRNDPWSRALMTSMGPGFTAGFVVLDR